MSYPPTRPLLHKQPSSPSFQGTLRESSVYDVESTQARPEKSYTSSTTRSTGWVSNPKSEDSCDETDYRSDLGSTSQPQLSEIDPHGPNPDPDGKRTWLYDFLSNASTFTRWTLIIIPTLTLIWIPGILSISTFPNAKVLGVRLLWWSIWLSICWAGWWGVLAVTRIMPIILKWTLGALAASTRRYIDWTEALHRYITLFAWTLIIWISWGPLIIQNQKAANQSHSAHVVNLIAKLLFALYLCSAILLFEKFSIQWIAGKFHERSYAERIADQKFAVKSLAVLYQHSSNVPTADALNAAESPAEGFVNPRRILKQLREGVRMAATTTTTAFGTVASEITGSLVLQTTPQAEIKTILESQDKTTLLARRLFYSFAQAGSDYLLVEDIMRFFKNPDEAERVFALFDKDSNGDASREEIEMMCLNFHREQQSIEHSMRDLDSAVGRLDNILMSLYVVVAALIIAAALETQIITLITGTGTLILGLSWLIGGSLQEVLTSIIFLFIKHPFDVGDRVDIDNECYTVKEIRLLSTVFLNSKNVSVQAPNTVLNSLFIQNIRRSPQMSEIFTFDVSYDTTFEDLERLREKMLGFVKTQRRDYQPAFDVMVKDFPDQEKMTLAAEIKYKSNGQQGALKAKRRNRWMCALKTALAEVKIYGPNGDPNAALPVTRYVNIPWDQVQAVERESEREPVAFPIPIAVH